MTVIKGTGFYNVEASNTNRQVTFSIVAGGGGATNAFLFLKGNNAFHPWIGQISAPTTNQKIQQYRANYVIRALSVYAIVVGAEIATTNVANDTINLTFETYVGNALPDQTDISDTLGVADRTAKTKDGLQTIATSLISSASLDGGSTLLFSANPHLPDGTASTAGAITSLTVTRVTSSMY